MPHNLPTSKNLNMLKFSVWDCTKQHGHAQFVGGLVETAHYLEENDIEKLKVSALDLKSMKSLVEVTAESWLDWYYRTALSALEENDYDDAVSVGYLGNYFNLNNNVIKEPLFMN